MGIERLTDLSIRASSMEPRVDGTPLRGLGWLEVSVAMASLTNEGSDLLRAVYLDDRLALKRTLGRLLVRVSGSKMLTADMRSALAVTAMQAFFAMRTCGSCDGAGYIDAYVCPTCNGAKVDHLPVSAVRGMLGVSEQVFDAILAEPFGELYREVHAWHDDACLKLSRKVR